MVNTGFGKTFTVRPPLTTTAMKSIPFVLAALASAAFANTAPTVVIQSAAMRPGTTLMDVVYRTGRG